jgi:hypothetical protein
MENGGCSTQALVDEGRASASLKASLSMRHKRSERSCLMCHRRKTRCDKGSPRSHFLRADVLCYPGERIGRKPHKTTIAEVAPRVARLEPTITAISNGASHTDSNRISIPAITSSLGEVDMNEPQTAGVSPEELLLQDGYSSRYVNEALLFAIYFAATISLTSTNAANLLSQPKSTAPNNYKQGLEQSLACANILDTPSMRSL